MMNQHNPSLARMSVFGITYLQKQSPLMIAWWSAVFPGFGHFFLNHYLRATFLALSEVFINTFAHINDAMIYSFCGKFELAQSVVQPKWAFGYLIIYLISIWDSYRLATYQNKIYDLTYLKNIQIPNVGIFPSEVQFLDRKKPSVGAIYSFLFPGLGQLYAHRFGLSFYTMIWWWIYLFLSRLHESLLQLVLGNLHASSLILQPHWLLFMPSVMGGAIYHAYTTVIEHNKLYRISQRQYLTNRYRNDDLFIFHKQV
jgi:TM2 domain-containing membrane protein YozV